MGVQETNIIPGSVVEHKDKQSNSVYPHTGKYIYEGDCRMKEPVTGSWVDAVIYRDVQTNQIFVRDKRDFLIKFKTI